jgi:protein TonB
MPRQKKTLAIASLVIGLISLPTAGLLFIGALAGVILGVVALAQAQRRPDAHGGRELALAGIAASALSVVAAIPMIVLLVQLHRLDLWPWQDIPERTPSEDDVFLVPPPPPPPPSPIPTAIVESPRRGATPIDARVLSRRPSASPRTPVRIGGKIKEPKRLRYVQPVYPEIARQGRVEGVVKLECVVAPDGRVTDVRVLQSVPLLDQAAIDAVRQWEYTPTLLNGVPVPVVMTVSIRFKLR